jgi:hypothetical protein
MLVDTHLPAPPILGLICWVEPIAAWLTENDIRATLETNGGVWAAVLATWISAGCTGGGAGGVCVGTRGCHRSPTPARVFNRRHLVSPSRAAVCQVSRQQPHLRRHSPPCSPYEGQHSAQAVPSGEQRLHGPSVHGESKPAGLGSGARAWRSSIAHAQAAASRGPGWVVWAVLTTDGLALVGGGGTADGRIPSDGSDATRGLAVRPGTSTMQHIRGLLPPARSSSMAAILNAILSRWMCLPLQLAVHRFPPPTAVSTVLCSSSCSGAGGERSGGRATGGARRAPAGR